MHKPEAAALIRRHRLSLVQYPMQRGPETLALRTALVDAQGHVLGQTRTDHPLMGDPASSLMAHASACEVMIETVLERLASDARHGA